MVNINKLSSKFVLTGLALCMSMSVTLANTLSEVEVNSLGNGYGVVLKTDATTQVKKSFVGEDRMVIELKDVSISEDINTVYTNVSDLDNVTILPAGKNNVKITLKGANVSDSRVSFDTTGQSYIPANTAEKEVITLNAPISTYKPVYTTESFVVEEIDQTSNSKLNEVLTQMHITREMLVTTKKYAKSALKKAKNMFDGDMNYMTIAGIFMIFAALILRPSREKKSKKQIPLSGNLTNVNLNREIELNKDMASNMNLRQNSMNATQSGYGIRAYQQSQRNPYMTSNASQSGVSGISRRSSLASTSSLRRNTTNAKPITKESAPLKQPLKTAKATTPVKTQLPKMQLGSRTPLPPQSSDLDSMKFLESITKIYENSGRSDLAKGLKDNLRKAQLTQV
jgi:hypothetical protein